jgi:hypothetical protein
MPLKAGDVQPLAYTLETIGGVKQSYADATALLAAGWTFEYWIAGVLVSGPTWSWTNVNTVSGQGELLLTTQLGQGTAYLRPPAGYFVNVECYELDVESVDLDVIAAKIDASAGTPSPDARATVYDYTLTEGDSFQRVVTIPSAALADFGLTTLSSVTALSGAARSRINRLDTSPDFTFTVVIVEAAARTVAIGWNTFPTGAGIGAFAITVVSIGSKTFTIAGDQRSHFDGITRLLLANSTGNDGYYTIASMALVGGATVFTVSETPTSATADGSIGQADDTKDFLWDLQITFPKAWSITAVSTGSKKFTVSGDQRRWMAVGASIAVTASTGNNGTYTISTLTLVGGNTEIVVVEAVPSAVADGTLTAAQKITPLKGTFTITRQEDRT